MSSDDPYVLPGPERILQIRRVIASAEFEHFLQELIPAILKCTETELVVWDLVLFRRDDDGHFLMCFENNQREVRAIHSTNPHWDRQVEEMLRAVMEEKDVVNAFPQTDFENAKSTDSDHP